MTKIIGLTGGIGSGKTMIAKYIQSLGIPVYIADDEAKKALNLPEVAVLIKEKFGNDIFFNGMLSREELAKIVFNNPEKLKELNQIIHPVVKHNFDVWLKEHSQEPIIVKEAAILFESGSYKQCDAIITVVAPLEIRVQRVLERDKTTLENVTNRIKNQWTDEMRIKKSDYVVENVDFNDAKLQIDQILKKMMNQ